jgi:hypothetical protein
MSTKEKIWMFWLLALMVLGLLTSCKTKYVTVPEYHTEYVYRTDSIQLRDSIYMKDSIYIIKNGDTVTTYKIKYVYRDRYRDVVKVDSFIKTDSIRVPYPVEKEISLFKKLRFGVNGLLVGVVLLVLFLVIRKVKFKG